MRKIRITDFHIQLAKQYFQDITHPECINCKNPLSEKKCVINPLCNLRKLQHSFSNSSIKITTGSSSLPSTERNTYGQYVKEIIKNFESIVTGTPSTFDKIIAKFESLSIKLDTKLSINGKKEQEFWKILVENLQYKEIRNSVMPRYIKEMGIKTCVYCNANYTITDTNNIAYFQLDHWKDKSHYPYLAISFFNLQPCCASCNLHKSNDDKCEYMQLYEDKEDKPLDMFKFEFKEGALASYITDHNATVLAPVWANIDCEYENVRNDMDSKLHITDIYAEHVDEIEELVWRSLYGRNSFIDALNKAKLGIKLTNGEVNRFILGTYSDAEDVHKRPLTKLKQDLGKKLKLL